MRDPKDLMWAQACALLDKAERLQRQFFEPSKEGARTARWEPPIDIFETARELFIIAAMPGVPPEAVRVDMQGEVLIIVGHRPLPSKDRHANIVRLEIPYGHFERRIALRTNRLKLAGRELLIGCLVLTFTKLD